MTSSYPMSGLHFFSVEGKNEKKETNKSIFFYQMVIKNSIYLQSEISIKFFLIN